MAAGASVLVMACPIGLDRIGVPAFELLFGSWRVAIPFTVLSCVGKANGYDTIDGLPFNWLRARLRATRVPKALHRDTPGTRAPSSLAAVIGRAPNAKAIGCSGSEHPIIHRAGASRARPLRT